MNISRTQILPLVLMVIDLGAAVVCLWSKEYKRTIYWLAAAVLNWTVTF